MKIVLLSPSSKFDGIPLHPGQGPLVLSAPDPVSVAFATRLFPDRRIEVKALYGEPRLSPGVLSLLGFLAGLKKADETPEHLKARVVACATRLIGISKSDGEGIMVAGPILSRLLGLKLAGIGYRGPFLRSPRPGIRREFEYPS
ncbi:MAG: hypothetical protein V4498_09650 [candidate division FCPU426 bacterium]